VRTVTNGLNAALAVTVNPQQALDAFADGIGSGDAIRYRRADASPAKPKIRLTTDGVPAWFVSLLRIPNLATATRLPSDSSARATFFLSTPRPSGNSTELRRGQSARAKAQVVGPGQQNHVAQDRVAGRR
jgi:hypothetical protein